MTLTEALLARLAGWDAIKQARALLAADRVLSSDWQPPLLRGVVQDGSTSYRAGLVIKSERDVENICSCRAARDWGTICAHSVAVGLHFVKPAPPGSTTSAASSASPPASTRNHPTGTPRPIERPVAGPHAELWVILPPNFTEAIRRGKIMLCFEAVVNDRRTPLNALASPAAVAWSDQDAEVLNGIEQFADRQWPTMLLLSPTDFVSLLTRLAGHPRFTLGRSTPLTVLAEPWIPPLQASLESSGEIVVRLAGTTTQPLPLLLEGQWVYQSRTFQPLGLPASLGRVIEAPVRLARSAVPSFLMHDWPTLAAMPGLEANFTAGDFFLDPQPPGFQLQLTGGLARLEALLQCAYGPRVMTVSVTAEDEPVWLPDEASPTKYGTRDVAAERAAINRLRRAGFTGPDPHGKYHLVGQERVLDFFARDVPRLQREWQVTIEDRLERSRTQQVERIEPQFTISSSGIQWFDLGVVFTTRQGERFSAAEIQRLLLSGHAHTRLPGGKFALLDTGAVEEWQEVLLDCSPQQLEGKYRLSSAQAGFIDATLREQPNWQLTAPEGWREQARTLSGRAKPECPSLGALESVLRPYQKEGVAWLRFLRENKFGGILADEMGLGKTVQTLAFLQWARNNRPESDAAAPRRPSLIVCPTSLVFNWLAEAARFTPDLQIVALHGDHRAAAFSQVRQADLAVTSYALIRRDAEKYDGLEFDTVVLDEAQHIKNRQTQNAQAVKRVRSEHRLVLTGTPLENSVLDLWSIFDFLMPGYLGSARDFRERYEIPLTRHQDAAAQARLARRLRPFILRRLKRDVAAELPEKIEQVAYCSLSEAQRQVYEAILAASRQEVLEAVGAQGFARSRVVVLNALLRLRQICCDLRLLKWERTAGEGSAETPGHESLAEPDAILCSEGARTQARALSAGGEESSSGKLELFSELIEEAVDGGHRVLVFSQFVSMLRLLRERLDAAQISYCYLDGSTRDRAQVVERFQREASIPLFLISLKAGGVGLNLAGADTVIHFDPWWNPAVEAQATDRAHRFGQTRVVTSYKLITRGTVEEKILSLQARKREVIASILGESELAQTLTWEEIQELLA